MNWSTKTPTEPGMYAVCYTLPKIKGSATWQDIAHVDKSPGGTMGIIVGMGTSRQNLDDFVREHGAIRWLNIDSPPSFEMLVGDSS